MSRGARGPDPFPGALEPMKAVAVDRPPEDDGRWAFEVKWDGVRTLAYVRREAVHLQSRSLRDVTASYPELRVLGSGPDMVLDGEVVAFDAAGRPSFERLQQRINIAGPAALAARTAAVPVHYMVFDLIHLDGRSLLEEPYTRRRELLAGLGLGADGGSVLCPAYHVGDGPALLAATRRQGLEGLVAKRLDSPYLPGRRSRCWLKVKNFRRQELVIGGWVAGEGGRRGTVGALLVGYYDGGSLRYAGRVGSGLSAAELDLLHRLLAALTEPESPFSPPPEVPAPVRRAARWTRPELVAEVAFREWTAGGTLRQPSYKGLRPDRDPRSVVREPA